MEPHHETGTAVPVEAGARPGPVRQSPTILRFLTAERLLHWALAIPFVLLYATALGMAVLYAEPSPRHFKNAFALLHRGVGVALVVLPPLALLRGIRDWRMHLENMREGWTWRKDDFRWLVLFPRYAMDPRVKLPEQGKFNAAEKLNFMMVQSTYPFYIVTGILVWLPGSAALAYLAHLGVAIMGLPLVLGHIFMATVNPETKVGLSGMITGWVDREWARHHYRRWYRDRIEMPEKQRAARELASRLAKPARVKCASCQEVAELGTWRELIQRSFQVEPVFCGACEAPIPITLAESARPLSEAIVRHLEVRGADEPFEPGESVAA
ncbi:MAG: cytochrome b/b6 domain-containing protein [Candidatus Eisenbacteria bacterium]|nr:cytochrome b/b6 domain-containing protein [Candidatus Eisenbacteria bacterium]